MKYIIDRFEEDFAICETGEGDSISHITIPRTNLPDGAREGDILEPDGSGGYILLADETEARRRAIRDKLNRLLGNEK